MTENQNKYTPIDLDVAKFEGRAPGVPAPVKTDNTLLMEAIRNKYDPEFIREMMALERERKADIAKEAYVEAKSRFKKIAPVVIRDQDNKQYDSKYASEGALLNTLNPVLAECDLDISFSFPEVEKGFAVTCTMRHKLGHSESVTLPGPLDTSGSKNPLQQVKSTVTYLRKATFEAITGVATSDPKSDDDGNAAGNPQAEVISEEQAKEIKDRLNAVYGEVPESFLNWIKAEKIELIKADYYESAIKAIHSAERKARKAEKKTTENAQREPGQEG